ncbi:MAG: hypothetical protein HYR72_11855 [Deltaproteobacteria bacterium]|nr:hypothetical protein [Deltaproteobacteria bacterium]MBI3386729.1 hypothetical protein [Deltaproteobacteria bacterium]
MTRILSRWWSGPSILLLTITCAAAVRAQCTGDCDGSGAVTVDELVVGVSIALGTVTVDHCPSFDSDHSNSVTVDELVVAVNAALNTCPSGTTPTPSPTVTPTPMGPRCGDHIVQFDRGETCDDGNTVDGDNCPATCVIHTCASAGTTLDLDVSFTPPVGVDIAGITVFLRYPDDLVRIPGMASDAAVQDRLSNLPDNTFATPNDLDYALRLVMLSPDTSPILPGLLFSVQFDACQSARVPTAADFRCVAEDAANTDLDAVAGVTCTVAVR